MLGVVWWRGIYLHRDFPKSKQLPDLRDTAFLVNGWTVESSSLGLPFCGARCEDNMRLNRELSQDHFLVDFVLLSRERLGTILQHSVGCQEEG